MAARTQNRTVCFLIFPASATILSNFLLFSPFGERKLTDTASLLLTQSDQQRMPCRRFERLLCSSCLSAGNDPVHVPSPPQTNPKKSSCSIAERTEPQACSGFSLYHIDLMWQPLFSCCLVCFFSHPSKKTGELLQLVWRRPERPCMC